MSRHVIRRILLIFLIAWGCDGIQGNVNSDQLGNNLDAINFSNHSNGTHNFTKRVSATVQIYTWKYDEVQKPLLILVFFMTLCFLKIIFEHCHWLNELIPETCMLMLIGIPLGFLLFDEEAKTQVDFFLTFNSQSFFIYLLPPIVLEAAYSFKDRIFFENLGTILLLAFLGTLLMVFIVGPALYGFYLLGIMGRSWTMTFLECLLFATIIAATDPVAVLATFQNMGVHKALYFLVAGESLLNDGVAIVLYNCITDFMSIEFIGLKEIGMGILSFICVVIGATIIGIFCGFMTALMTKCTSKIEVLEPFLVLGFAYLSYLIAQMVGFSGMISLISCGLIQAIYAMPNISSMSLATVKQVSKITSTFSESLLFIMLSVMAVNIYKAWSNSNIGFMLTALVLCLMTRFIITYGLIFCVNRLSIGFDKINQKDQFILAYSGLRGPVTFSLVFSLDYNLLMDKEKTQYVFMTSAYIVIYFTTFLQGLLVKPLTKKLKVKLYQPEMPNASAPETSPNNYRFAKIKYFSQRYLRPFFTNHHLNKDISLTTINESTMVLKAYSFCRLALSFLSFFRSNQNLTEA